MNPLAAELQADALERFLRYVRIDTQSARESDTYPSTLKQLDLSRLLEGELRALGLEDVELTEHGYVFATLPGGDGPDGRPARPRRRLARCARRRRLARSSTRTTTAASSFPASRPRRARCSASGSATTSSPPTGRRSSAPTTRPASRRSWPRSPTSPPIPRSPHAPARVAFTVDEEVGHGTDHFDLEHFGATFAYTLDGSVVGEIENETFSAVELKVTFRGRRRPSRDGEGQAREPGQARGAARREPADGRRSRPRRPRGARASSTRTRSRAAPSRRTVTFILRDHDDAKLDEHEALVRRLAEEVAPDVDLRALGAVPQHGRGARQGAARRRGRARGDAPGRARARRCTRSAAAPTARGSPRWASRRRTSSPAGTSTTRCASGSACRTWRSRPRRSSSC